MDDFITPKLLETVPPPLRAIVGDPAVQRTLRSRYDAGREAWPSLAVTASEWANHFVSHLKTKESIARPEQLSPDFLLAVALVRGDKTALQVYAQTYRPRLMTALARKGGTTHEAQGIVAAIEHRLFVPEGGLRIASYSGRGALDRFLRVAAINQLIDTTRTTTKEVTLDEQSELALFGDAPTSPELVTIARNSSEVFGTALRSAFAQLEPRQRVVLRMHTFEHATIDDLAALYRVHRVTAFRWVETARAQLRAHTEAALKGRFALGSLEVTSFIRELPRLELSLESMLSA